MKKYAIDEQTLSSILSYLQGRPYAEVFQGIEALRNLPLVNPTELAKAGDGPSEPTES